MLTRLKDKSLNKQKVDYKDTTPPEVKKAIRKSRSTRKSVKLDPSPESLPFPLVLETKSRHFLNNDKSSMTSYPARLTIPFKNRYEQRSLWIQWCDNLNSWNQNLMSKTCEDLSIYVNHVKKTCVMVLNDPQLLLKYKHINWAEIQDWIDEYIFIATPKKLNLKAGDIVGTNEPIACGETIGNNYHVAEVISVPSNLPYGWEFENDRNIKLRLVKRELLLGKKKELEFWSNNDLHLFGDEEKQQFQLYGENDDEKNDVGVLYVNYNEIKKLASSKSDVSRALNAFEYLFKAKYKSDRIAAACYEQGIREYLQELGAFFQAKISSFNASDNVSEKNRTFWILESNFKGVKLKLKENNILWDEIKIKKKHFLRFKDYDAANIEKVLGFGSMMFIHVLAGNVEDTEVYGKLHILGLTDWVVDLRDRRLKIKYSVCHQKVVKRNDVWMPMGSGMVSKLTNIPWFKSMVSKEDNEKIPVAIHEENDVETENNIKASNNNNSNVIKFKKNINNKSVDSVELDENPISMKKGLASINVSNTVNNIQKRKNLKKKRKENISFITFENVTISNDNNLSCVDSVELNADPISMNETFPGNNVSNRVNNSNIKKNNNNDKNISNKNKKNDVPGADFAEIGEHSSSINNTLHESDIINSLGTIKDNLSSDNIKINNKSNHRHNNIIISQNNNNSNNNIETKESDNCISLVSLSESIISTSSPVSSPNATISTNPICLQNNKNNNGTIINNSNENNNNNINMVSKEKHKLDPISSKSSTVTIDKSTKKKDLNNNDNDTGIDSSGYNSKMSTVCSEILVRADNIDLVKTFLNDESDDLLPSSSKRIRIDRV